MLSSRLVPTTNATAGVGNFEGKDFRIPPFYLLWRVKLSARTILPNDKKSFLQCTFYTES